VSIYQVQKDLRPIVSAAIGRGCWELERAGGKHYIRLRHSSGRIVPLHGSKTSEALASRKLRSQLARIERDLTGNA
jgi:hypothetical protein